MYLYLQHKINISHDMLYQYNNCDTQMCQLKQIVVSPLPNCDTKKCDESMCSSYEYCENN